VTYEPGTNVLVTTWKTPSGWLVVRDALTMGPTQGEDVVTPHTRPPVDDDAEHTLVRTVECLEGRVEIELVCEPVFDYGREPAEWTLDDGNRHAADTSFDGQALRLKVRSRAGSRGNRVRARHVLEAGDRAFCALSWAEGLVTRGRRRRRRTDSRPRASGERGSGEPGFPTTTGATRSSARPDDRVDPCRPAPRSRHSRPAA
jgi:GH15 family glucan-1,4-alpha-glucosidase